MGKERIVYLGIGVSNALYGHPTSATVAAAFKYVGPLKFTRPLALSIAEGRRRREWTCGGCSDACKYAYIDEEHRCKARCDIPWKYCI